MADKWTESSWENPATFWTVLIEWAFSCGSLSPCRYRPQTDPWGIDWPRCESIEGGLHWMCLDSSLGTLWDEEFVLKLVLIYFHIFLIEMKFINGTWNWNAHSINVFLSILSTMGISLFHRMRIVALLNLLRVCYGTKPSSSFAALLLNFIWGRSSLISLSDPPQFCLRILALVYVSF